MSQCYVVGDLRVGNKAMALLSTCHIAAACSNNIHHNFLYSDDKYSNSFIPGEIYPTTLCVGLGRGLRLTSIPRKTTTTTTRRSYRRFNHARAEAAETMATTEKLGIKIIRNPPETKLADLGVRSWPKWGCPPSKFPWTYSSKETCYLLKGKVKVYPDKYDEAVEIGAGDLVVFPKGMSCTWDVSETVDKHYIFE